MVRSSNRSIREISYEGYGVERHVGLRLVPERYVMLGFGRVLFGKSGYVEMGCVAVWQVQVCFGEVWLLKKEQR